MNTTTFTSTINPAILRWANKYAKRTNKTRREILEEALEEYRDRETKDLLKSSLTRAAQDMDTEEMAEWGMSDYGRLLK